MRHFSLMRFLVLSSIATKSEGLSTSTDTTKVGQHQGTTFPGRKLASALTPPPVVMERTAVSSSPSSKRSTTVGRRGALSMLLGGSLVFAASGSNTAHALDMDAFINKQLDEDTTNCNPKTDKKCAPKLSSDEALCKYGQSGEARGEACARFKAQGGQLAKPGSEGKSLGGAYAI